MPTKKATHKKLFDRLASAQRGAPEDAMLRIQHAQVSQLYGNLAEHVGDLTHRMSEYPEHPNYYNGYPYVHSKVEKTLRWLRNPYGFEREVEEQAHSNYEYCKREGCLSGWYTSPETGLEHLARLGQKYADEHRKLPVFNEVQRTAQEAAIAVGEFRFEDAEEFLAQLGELLEEGPEAWAAEAGKVSWDPVSAR